jgi:chromosome segregation ATPase
MTTKEQERKALEKIRAIVAELGENSYVGTALMGTFELAEQNIEFDAAFSLLTERDDVKQELEAAKEKIVNLNRDAEITNALNNRLNDRIEEYQGQIRELQTKFDAASETKLMLEDVNAAHQKLVVELKAKCYDLMTAGA